MISTSSAPESFRARLSGVEDRPGARGLSNAPLIVTAKFDPETFAILDDLRRAHFPPERNFIPAHLTLFHALPGDRLGDVIQTLRSVTARHPACTLAFPSLRSLGRGVALDVRAPALGAIRQRIGRDFDGELTAQDTGGFRPHVTIQNKVPPDVAKRLLSELSAGFVPWTGQATGVLLWRYLGGPWSLEAEFPFA